MDYVSAETFKVLGGVNRSEYKSESDNDEHSENGRVEKHVIKLGTSTLETKPENIMAKKFDLSCDLDVHFQALS